ncbi:MAG: N-6 DNA methylase [Actinomycetota bacterium]|nr:N-6 DNA methylase [Actinomycetota bacterium]
MDFKQTYQKDNFVQFLKSFLPDDFETDQEELNNDYSFKFIEKVAKLGECKSLDLKIYEINHKSENDPRVTLSKEAFRLMHSYASRRSLVIFRNPKTQNYRLSLITFQSSWDTGKKIKTEFSNPRRYSFYLGPDAKTKTPESFLIKKGEVKGFDDLLSRFSVEIVTKEFFNQYKQLYIKLLNFLENDHAFKAFASQNGIQLEIFAKKILGQIVFIYFLQKKGWLGAEKGEHISKGDKTFLRTLFNKCQTNKQSFFNDYLEPLFYDCLNRKPDMAGSFYRSIFECQIPFLNGGLFEPINNYNWQNEFVHIPNEIFSNNENGILDIFDLYNFTIDENTPDDQDISVDPEMLGKVFENLLEDNIRKGQGAFYTPREIVHYMCQESLINFLNTNTQVKDAKSLLGFFDLDKPRQLGINPELAKEVDKALEQIKVVDPACGSGAFLIGMLQLIVQIREMMHFVSNNKISEYKLKKQTIENCIYGVDIDPGAVDIAKLRLWLSLVVDEDIDEIEPLPNLDYKIMQGNSLLENLVVGDSQINFNFNRDKKIDRRTKETKSLFQSQIQNKLFFDKSETLAEQLEKLHTEFFNASDLEIKKRLKRKIDNIEDELIQSKCQEEIQNNESQIKNSPNDSNKILKNTEKILAVKETLDKWKKDHLRPFFPWKLHFGEVFNKDNPGFDIVIANPPYISHVNINNQDKAALTREYETYLGRADIYVVFYERGIRLLKQKGILAYISPNKFFRAGYGDQIRKYLKSKTMLLKIIDFGDTPIFDATTYPAVLIIKKTVDQKYTFDFIKTDNIIDFLNEEKFHKFDSDYLKNGLWSFDNSELAEIWEKMQGGSILLSEYTGGQFYRGIVTGLNEAFIINEITKKRIIKKNPVAAEIIKPYLKGRDAKRWISGTNLYILFTYHGIDINKYPTVKDYLLKFKDKLLKRATSDNHEWYELQQPQTGIYNYYEGAKIISTDIASKCEFTLDETGAYIDATIFCIPKDDLFLLAVLNSYLIESFYRSISSTVRGDFLRFKKIYMDMLPIKIPNDKKPFIEIVDKILAITKSNDYLDNQEKQEQVKIYENQIDQLVYELYGLTPEEIKIVEEINGSKH